MFKKMGIGILAVMFIIIGVAGFLVAFGNKYLTVLAPLAPWHSLGCGAGIICFIVVAAIYLYCRRLS